MIEQTMQNIADAQYPNGALPEIAPNYVIFEALGLLRSWSHPNGEVLSSPCLSSIKRSMVTINSSLAIVRR